MPSRAKGSTRQHAYHHPRAPDGAVDTPNVRILVQDGTLPAVEGGSLTSASTASLYGVVVEKPLEVIWGFFAAMERWVRPEVIAVLLISYLFIGLPLIVTHWF